MGKLLQNTLETRNATNSESFHNLLDSIEGDFLAWKKFERNLLQKVSAFHGDIIDISSANSMNIFESANESVSFDANVLKKSVTTYPFIIPKENLLEVAFSELLQNFLAIKVPSSEILVTNGTYAAVRSLVRAFPGDIVLVPEFMNQAQKSSITAIGKKVVEVPMLTPGWKLDLNSLLELLREHNGNISCMYIHHVMSADLDEDYFMQIATLLETAGAVPVIDIDIIKTTHSTLYTPTLPLKVSSLAKRGIFLFTLSKEFGAPGVRVGFATGPRKEIEKIQLFLQQSLEMVPPTSRVIALEIIKHYNLTSAANILHKRMCTLAKSLQSLKLEASIPNIGVNLFMHVPRGWEKANKVLPDHLFTYYCLTRAGVILRPGSIYGHRLNHFVRFVVGQPEAVIHETINRLQVAGVRGDMPFPDGLETEYEEVMRVYRIKNNHS